MASSLSFVFILCVLLLLHSSNIVECAGNISALIAFGDSILDTGNNNNLLTTSKCNFPPYGMSFPGKVATGRFCNGKVFSDLLAEGLGLRTPIPAYLSKSLKQSDLPNGICFASGGSGLDDRTATFQGVITFPQQINYFKDYQTKLKNYVGEEKAKSIISNALFLISSGNNDLGLTYYSFRLRPAYNIFTYTTRLTGLAEGFIKELYGLGARRIAFMGTLPLGCLPGARALVGEIFCNEFVNKGAEYFNSQLQSTIETVAKSMPDAKIFYLDVYNPLLNIVRNPQQFGFENPNIGCAVGLAACTDPSTHVFWDFAHPTEKAYRAMVGPIIKKYAAQFS